MNFLFDDEQELLRDSARRLLQRLVPSEELRRLIDSESGFSEQLWRRAAELGSLSMLASSEHGGGSLTDQGLVDAVLLAEEWGRALAPGPFISTQVVCHALSRYGTGAQQDLLPQIVAGELLVTWCFAEEDAQWEPADLQCSARASGDGYVLDGVKLYVEDAQLADYFLVTARSDDALVQLLVPASTPGVSVESHASLDASRRLGAVTFRDVQLPPSAALALSDDAAVDAQLRIAAVLICADSIGGAQRCLELTVAYTKERVQFGRPIASFQAVKHRCADLLILLENARAAAHYAALAVHEQAEDAALAVSLAKAYVGDAFATITGEATQLHGGIAFTWEYDMHFYVRRAKANEVLFGPPSWHRQRSWKALTWT
jgi:alkylation response protein AidB-like acyl-CoA dehydrogenase